MIGSILFWGYVVPLILCLVSAAWYQWFDRDPKASLGAVTALIVAFVPVINIWWIISGVCTMLGIESRKGTWFGTIEEHMWTATMASCGLAVIAYERVTSLWRRLKQRFTD